MDISQYTLGYQPIETPAITGEAILAEINYDTLHVVAAGGSGAVVTDGTYAIKIGRISAMDYEQLSEAAAVGWSMPVLYHEQGAAIHPCIVEVLYREEQYLTAGGWHAEAHGFLHMDNRADIMISMLVEPLIDPLIDYRRCDEEKSVLYKLATSIEVAFKEATGKRWWDSHPWNLGIYKGGIIILDF